MTPRHSCLAALLVLALAAQSQAQTQPCCPPLPGRGPSPLLFVRIAGPAGTRVTFYQGRARPREFPGPAVVGLRPGYGYRFMMSEFPDRPGLTLFPTLTVFDSLHLPPQLRAANHPATVVIDEDDIDAIRRGSMVTKLIYLEHPDRAIPVATTSADPIQTTYPPNSDLWKEARQRGRPMILVHLGQRVPTGEELVRQNVPGTILHPGEKCISQPALPPQLHTPCGPLFDPILGPKKPEEECFHDGGDRGRKAALDGCGGLFGLDPEDTVAVYRDSAGRKSVVCSNRVCICVPRFPILRTECPLAIGEDVLAVNERNKAKGPQLFARREPPLQALKYEHPNAFRGRLRPSENVNTKTPAELIGMKVLEATQLNLGPFEFVGTKKFDILAPVQKVVLLKQLALAREFSGSKHVAGTDQVIGTSMVARVEGLDVIEARASTRDITVCCHEAPTPPDKPLFIVKCADKQEAQIGDIITFSIRYSNVGGRPITDVAIRDSLSGRLEYVEGSAETDRPAVFTTQLNEAGSLVLRWEISGKLLPGESGRVRFKAKVR